MLLIGDVHGFFENYRNILKRKKPDISIQLGDMGVGFPDSDELVLNDIPGKHYWLRGNHDSPKVSREHPNYIGDYGILEGSYINGLYNKLFYAGGAWSIDQAYRKENVSWWSDEQLSIDELANMVELYCKEKPDIVCSHDCPTSVLYHLYPSRLIPTRTSQAYDDMIFKHKPKFWIYAHHHCSFRKLIDGCLYICLNELEILDISKKITGGNFHE